MKSYSVIIGFYFFCLLLNSCASTAPVYKVTSKNYPSSQNGFYYALPKTEIIIDVTISQTITTPGPYKDFSILIGVELKDVPKDKKTEYKIEDVKLSSASVVDSSQWYYVDLHHAGLFRKVSVSVEQTESGIISSGKSEAEDQSVTIVTEVIELGATIASKFIPFNGTAKNLMSNSISMPDDKKMVIPTEISAKASIAAQLIFDLRERRLNLISNKTQNRLSAGTLQSMLKEIDSAEKDLVALFLGTKKIKTATIRFKTDKIENKPLFNFSTETGLSFVSQNTVGTIPTEFTSGKEGESFLLEFNSLNTISQRITNSPDNKKSSFYYRIPANFVVRVKKGSEVLHETEMLIAQKGIVRSLPLKTGSMKSKYDLTFDSKTGALTKISVNGESVSAESIDKLSGAGQKVLDVIKPGELSELEKQRKILEEKKKIKELNEELAPQ